MLREAPFQWWITGGWALDLFLGKQTRTHLDTDVAIARHDQMVAQHYLDDWDFYSTKRDGKGDIVLRQWETDEILGQEYPGVWARESGKEIWRFELLFHEISDQTWTFRYDDSVTHSLAEIGGMSPDSIPYLLPEVTLLHKAARLRRVDEQDFQRVLPMLNHTQRAQLWADLQIFEPEHPWLIALA